MSFCLESAITGLKIPVLLFHVFQSYYVVLQFACTCIMNGCCSENVRLSFFGLITMTHTPKVFHQTWITWGHRGFVEVSLIETSSTENWKKIFSWKQKHNEIQRNETSLLVFQSNLLFCVHFFVFVYLWFGLGQRWRQKERGGNENKQRKTENWINNVQEKLCVVQKHCLTMFSETHGNAI